MIAAIDLLGISAVVTSVGGVFIAYRSLRKITQVDVAVNGKKSGEQTISEDVSDLHAEIGSSPPPADGMNGGSLVATVRRLGPKVDHLDEKVDRLDGKVDHLEEAVEGIKQQHAEEGGGP